MKYGSIVIDPPWAYSTHKGITARTAQRKTCAEDHYPTMTNKEIAALSIGDFAEDNAHLYMWVTNPKLYGTKPNGKSNGPTPAEMMLGWGFRYVTMLTWIKKPGALGMGFYFRGETEHILFGIKGKCPIPKEIREVNWFFAPKKRHSQKPESFYDLVERVSPGPYLECFARRNRLGWDTWGDEALNHVEIGETA